MKIKSLTFVMVMISFCVLAQKDFTYGVGIGTHLLVDQSATLTDHAFAVDFNVTMNLNDTFGLGVFAGFDRMDMADRITGQRASGNYLRTNLELVVDLIDLVDLSDGKFLLLLHGGPGITYNGVSDEAMPNIGGGIDAVYMLSDHFGLKLGWRGTGNFEQDITLNGTRYTDNIGMNSHVQNAFFGLVWRPLYR